MHNLREDYSVFKNFFFFNNLKKNYFSTEQEINLSFFKILKCLNINNDEEYKLYKNINAFNEFFLLSTKKECITNERIKY
jgi:hypothetical protein